MAPDKIVISPGPGRPEDAGITCEVIREFSGKIPILGVCLGHQAIGYAFGGKIVGAKKLMHGKTSKIYHNKKDIFKNIPNPCLATRYHSLLVEKKGLPASLEITARTLEDEIMGLKHKEYPLWGVQFHPEFNAAVVRAYIDEMRPRLAANQQDADVLWASTVDTPYGAEILQRFARLAA